MKRDGIVVEAALERAVVTVGDDTPPGQGAACCSVLSVRMEVSNPRRLTLEPGDRVEISDGLGSMVFAGVNFLVLPGILGGLGSVLSFAGALVGAALGLASAFLIFKSLNLGQYPRILQASGARDRRPLTEADPEYWEDHHGQ